MPVRHRRSKARADELAAWADAFKCEFDYAETLPDIGIATDDYGLPDRVVAEEAWHRLGAAFLETYNDPHLTPWALEAFGPPSGSGKRRRRRAGA